MSFQIPGYFLDLETKKYYKITTTGPYSMAELKKRLAKEEESKQQSIKRPAPPPPTLVKLIRQRAVGSLHCKPNFATVLRNLRHQNTVVLNQSFKNSKMTFGNLRDGCLWTVSANHLYTVGYQLSPCFQIWTSQCRNIDLAGPVNTISCISDDLNYSINIGTSDGRFYKINIPQEHALSHQQIDYILPQGSLTSGPTDGTRLLDFSDYSELPSMSRKLFSTNKETVWSSAVDEVRKRVLVGGEKSLYLLKDSLQLIKTRKLSSAVFDIVISKYRAIGLVGLRNGRVLSVDLRDRRLSFELFCSANSSVTKIAEIDEMYVLTVCLDGSIDVWKIGSAKTPIRSFKGHINEATHGLAFDLDLNNQLLLVAGNDGHVRVWSLLESAPIWTSEKFKKPVTTAKIFVEFPNRQPNWPPYLVSKHQTPGVLIFTEENDFPVVKYYCIL
ncbi:WD40-repeat-containing domain protein [Sporodiniella umbellata]|nr:WD40-repeat-containing domain protein [Sporodiniella umbellata]